MLKKLLLVVVVFQLSACDTLQQLANNAASGAGLTTGEIIGGLKEALNQGVSKGTGLLAMRDGFFKNLAVKILLPPEAQSVAAKLTDLGFGSLVDNAVEKLNRAAEDAAIKAGPIFLDAIKKMTFNDAKNILMGSDNAATTFLKGATSAALYSAFQPIIKSSLNKVGAVDAWNKVFDKYNMIPFVQKVNPNLDDHVTKKAIDGVFHMVEGEEKEIRKNPGKRATALLKKVFAQQD